MDFKERAEKERIKKNKRLAEIVKNGGDISKNVSPEMMWFPPRPIIKKDKKAIKILYPEVDDSE